MTVRQVRMQSHEGHRWVRLHNRIMTPEERAQLVEDIRVSAAKRRAIAERAALDEQFDIAAAWRELRDLEREISRRLPDAATD
jgi:hypothetical protein